MAAAAPGKGRTIAIWSLRVVLGLLFLIVGTTKLTGTGNTVEYFTAIGWGQWFRYLTGLLDIVGAVLLFVPRWTCTGAIVLACSSGSAAIISFTVLHGNPTWGALVMVLAPFVLSSLSVVLALLTRPHRGT
jgi:putative oxidoreductase